MLASYVCLCAYVKTVFIHRVKTAINSSGIPFLFAVFVKPKRTASYFLSACVLRVASLKT